MISIRESISELEKLERLRLLLHDCYSSAIRNLADYAIDLEEEITTPYRENLAALASEVETGLPQAISDSRATLRGLLRDFRDKAATYLRDLREELGRTADSLQRLVENISQGEGDQESRMGSALANLRDLAADPASAPISPRLRAAGEALELAVADFLQQQQLTASQLLTEIHLLHKRIEALESAVSAHDLTKLFNRQEIENRIRSVQKGGSLLLLRVDGFDRAAVQFSREVGRQLAAAFVKRLHNNLLPEAMVACWSKEGFVVLHPAPKEEVRIAADWVSQHLSGAYACLQGGKTVRPTIEVNVAVLELIPNEAVERTLQQISQFLEKQPQT